jgi:DHA1 family inner membrane transport protein
MTRPAPILFVSMFAAQAGMLVLAPILPEVSREFGVATATAGQLRLASGIAGGVTAVALWLLAGRLDLRRLLSLGLGLLAIGSLGSGLAPSFGVLAAAQLAIGCGLAMVSAAAVAAAAEWAAPGRRSSVLSWTLVGQPAAWVVGMPVAGAVAGIDWRLAWLVVPLAPSLLGLAAVRRRPSAPTAPASASGAPRILRDPAVAGWALGELFSFAGWGGTLVYCGALFQESYGISTAAVGLLLALGAVAYFPGSFLARRWIEHGPRAVLIVLALSLAAGVTAFGAIRPGAAFSAVLFGALVFLAGGRTLAGSTIGLRASEHKVAVTSIRAAATQFGYLLGAAAGGAALALGAYPAVGAVLGGLFVLSVLPHLAISLRARRPGRPRARGALGSPIPIRAGECGGAGLPNGG